jgi:hypothetical protein
LLARYFKPSTNCKNSKPCGNKWIMTTSNQKCLSKVSSLARQSKKISSSYTSWPTKTTLILRCVINLTFQKDVVDLRTSNLWIPPQSTTCEFVLNTFLQFFMLCWFPKTCSL